MPWSRRFGRTVFWPSTSVRSPQRRTLRFEALEDRRLLALITVSNLNDIGEGSLREAIAEANESVGVPDEIQFSVTGTVNIGSQLPTITDSLTITGPGQELFTIDAGNGADGQFATGDGWRIFNVDNGTFELSIDVTIVGLTVTGGDTTRGADGESGGPGEEGGAIRSRENLAIINSTVTGNATGGGGTDAGYYSIGGHGGGISSFRGDLTITSSTISGNTTGTGGNADGSSGNGIEGGHGGGIAFSNGNLAIMDSTIRGNTTGAGGNANGNRFDGGRGGHGGGIYSRSGDLTLIRSTIAENMTGAGGNAPGVAGDGGDGGNGGGIHFSNGRLNIIDSTISGNATGAGGSGTVSDGVGGDGSGGFGGGINSSTSLAVAYNRLTTVSNSTISGNSAAVGAGILNERGLVTIKQTTITDNRASDGQGSGVANLGNSMRSRTEIAGSIIAGNSSHDLAILEGNDNSFVSVGYNLIGSGADFNSGNQSALDIFAADATSLTGIDPLFGFLDHNGGPTKTHAILPGSPAIDAGDPTAVAGVEGVPEFDQRGDGFPRVADGNEPDDIAIDIGAYESQGIPSFPAGDYSHDGIASAVDYVLWRDTLGQNLSNGSGADGSGNGVVDQDDYHVWRANFGNTAVSLIPSNGNSASRLVASSPFATETESNHVVQSLSQKRTNQLATDEGFAQLFRSQILPASKASYRLLAENAAVDANTTGNLLLSAIDQALAEYALERRTLWNLEIGVENGALDDQEGTRNGEWQYWVPRIQFLRASNHHLV